MTFGSSRKAQELPERLEFYPVAEEPDLDVLPDEVEEFLLLPPPGNGRPHPVPPEVREVVNDRLVDRFRQDQLLRRLPLRVVPGKELFEETFGVLEDELVLLGEHPQMNVEEHEVNRPLALDIVDHVLVVGLLPLHILPLGQPFERGDLVAELECLLKLFAACPFGHLHPQVLDEPDDIPFQHRLRPSDALGVLLLGYLPDTGSAARPDMSPQARPFWECLHDRRRNVVLRSRRISSRSRPETNGP